MYSIRLATVPHPNAKHDGAKNSTKTKTHPSKLLQLAICAFLLTMGLFLVIAPVHATDCPPGNYSDCVPAAPSPLVPIAAAAAGAILPGLLRSKVRSVGTTGIDSEEYPPAPRITVVPDVPRPTASRPPRARHDIPQMGPNRLALGKAVGDGLPRDGDYVGHDGSLINIPDGFAKVSEANLPQGLPFGLRSFWNPILDNVVYNAGTFPGRVGSSPDFPSIAGRAGGRGPGETSSGLPYVHRKAITFYNAQTGQSLTYTFFRYEGPLCPGDSTGHFVQEGDPVLSQ